MAEKLEFRYDLLKGQTTIIEALDEAGKKAATFRATIGDTEQGGSFLKLASAVAVGEAAFELAKKAVEKFVDILKEGIKAAEEKESAINRLNLSLAQTGKYSEETSEKFLEFSETLRKTTRFSDDQIISNAAMLESLTGLTEGGLEQATKASANLAATLGIDLDTSTRLIAKSIEGNTQGLQRYGIHVRKGADETENFANTLKALQPFSGRAENDANTFSGALAKMSNAFTEVLAALGNLIIKNPIFIDLINLMGQAFNSLAKFIGQNQSVLLQFVNNALKFLGESLIRINPVFTFVIFSLTNILEIIRISIQGWQELFKIMSNFSFINDILKGFVVALLEIPKGIVLLIQLMTDLATSSSFFNNALKRAGINTADLNDGIQGVVDKIDNMEKTVKKIDFPKVTAEGLGNIDQMIGKSQEFLKAQNGAITTIGEKIIAYADKSAKFQATTVKNQEVITDNSNSFFVRIGNMFSSWDEFSTKISDVFSKPNRLTGLTKIEEALDKIGPTLIADMAKGGAAAGAIITDFGKTLGNTLIPGLGDAIAPFLDMFTKGPEYTKMMIKAFIDGIPIVIENFVESIPAIIDALIESMPAAFIRIALYIFTGQFMFRLVEGLISAFAKLPKTLIEAIQNGLTSFGKTVLGSIVGGVAKTLGQFFDGIGKGVGQFFEGAVRFVATILDGAVTWVAEILSGAVGFVATILDGAVKWVAKIIEGAGSFVGKLLEGVVVFVAKIIEGAVKFVGKILEGAGGFVFNIFQGAVQFTGKILEGAGRFVSGIVGGAGQFIAELIKGIPGVGGLFGGGGGDFIDGIVGGISDIFDFATGGKVPAIYASSGLKIPDFRPKGTDTVPAMLTPGEYVVDRSLTQKLDKFLDQQQNQMNSNILNQILFELKTPQSINTEVKLNNKAFADIILQLKKSNARLA